MKITKQALERIIKEEIDGVLSENLARQGTLQNIMNLLSDHEIRIKGLEMAMENLEDPEDPDDVIQLPDMGRIKDWKE